MHSTHELVAAAIEAGYVDDPALIYRVASALHAQAELIARQTGPGTQLHTQRRRLIRAAYDAAGIPVWIRIVAHLLPGPWGVAARLALFLVDLLCRR